MIARQLSLVDEAIAGEPDLVEDRLEQGDVLVLTEVQRGNRHSLGVRERREPAVPIAGVEGVIAVLDLVPSPLV